MTSLMLLSLLLNGFGWATMALLLGGIVAVLFQEPLMIAFAKSFSLDECETIEEILVIEDARAELAERLREKARRAREEAEKAQTLYEEICLDEIDRVITLAEIEARIYREEEEARFEACAARPEYWALWERTEKLTEKLDFLRSCSTKKLREVQGIGEKRARRIRRAGSRLTEAVLQEICGPKVAGNALAWGG